jgi:hypothetical protein
MMEFLRKWFAAVITVLLEPSYFFSKMIRTESFSDAIKFSAFNFAISGLLSGLLLFAIAGLRPTSFLTSILLGFHLFIGPTAVATFFLVPLVAFLLFATGLSGVITGLSGVAAIFFISIVMGILAPIVGGALAYAGVRAFGGKGTYEGTVRVFGYSSVTSLLSWIPIINFFASLYSIYLGIIGMYYVDEVEKKKDLVIIIGLLCLAYVVSALAGFYVLASVG